MTVMDEFNKKPNDLWYQTMKLYHAGGVNYVSEFQESGDELSDDKREEPS
jgi:hypothetical protein